MEAPSRAWADLNTEAGRFAASQAAADAATTVATPQVEDANAAEAFGEFLAQHLNRQQVNAIAAAADPATAAAAARTAAEPLQASSFYQDSRGVEMVDAVVAAAQAAGVGFKAAAAQNAAAAYADVADDYHRFISGKLFGDMITAAAATAAAASVVPGADESSITEAVDDDSTVELARAEIPTVRISAYDDTRASSAVDQVLAAVMAIAVAALPAAPDSEAEVGSASEQAGRDALADLVARFPRSLLAPTPDYNEFVASAGFAGSVEIAAEAAAAGAVTERRNNPAPFSTLESLERAARARRSRRCVTPTRRRRGWHARSCR